MRSASDSTGASGGGLVQIGDAFCKGGQAQRVQYLVGQGVGQVAFGEGGLHQFAQGGLRQAGGGGIDRRQRLGERLSSLTMRYCGCTISMPKKPWRTSPNRRTRLPDGELLDLAGVKIQEAQRHHAAAVLNLAYQGAARAVLRR